MRKFYLENSIGSRFGLNGENGIWLDSPSGLGISYAPNFADFGNGFYVNAFNKTKQGSIVCNLLFVPPGAYGRYQSFMRWIAEAGELKLVYDPDGSGVYIRAVEAEQISKSELTGAGELLCATTFVCLTPWYRLETISGSAGASNVTSWIHANGDLPSAFVISATISGTDPTIDLIDTANQTIGSASLTGSFSGSSIVLSTLPNDSYITQGGTDISEKLSVVTNPFFRLPSGMTAKISISVSATISVRVYHYWGTV